jgi:hypothetical protein
VLAHMTAEPPDACEPGPLDPTLAARALDEQGGLARIAYETALHLEADRWWTPARRRRATARPAHGADMSGAPIMARVRPSRPTAHPDDGAP